VEIIDAQIHEPPAELPWDLAPELKLRLSCELALAAMNAVGVDRALLHASAAMCAYAVEHSPDRFRGVAIHAGHRPAAEARALVERVSGDAGLLGLRMSRMVDWVADVPPTWPDTGEYDDVFSAAERCDVPILIAVPGYADVLAPIAARYPALCIIVDHLGLRQPPPMTADADPFARLPRLLELARFPNVAVKLSGAPSLSTQPFPHPDLWSPVRRVLDAFGADRVMWGSDYTRLRTTLGAEGVAPRSAWLSSYADSVGYLRHGMGLSAAEQDAIFSTTARVWLSWPKDN
jgi:predicted TIM-barrel fold metal-dependent hydrolase